MAVVLGEAEGYPPPGIELIVLYEAEELGVAEGYPLGSGGTSGARDGTSSAVRR